MFAFECRSCFLVSEGPKVYGSVCGGISWMQFFNNLKIEKYLVVKLSPNSQLKSGGINFEDGPASAAAELEKRSHKIDHHV